MTISRPNVTGKLRFTKRPLTRQTTLFRIELNGGYCDCEVVVNVVMRERGDWRR
ncbi:MAG: DUF2695 domain-containing protein [Planctomycetota bacterium]|jgi:hypothetical protein